MRRSNYITINEPNAYHMVSDAPFAKFIDAPHDDSNRFEDGIADVTVKDLYLPNFSVRISKGQFARHAHFVNTNASGIEMPGSCFFPVGDVVSETHNGKNRIETCSGTQNFLFDPNNEFVHKIPANTPFHLIHFAMRGNHFLGFLPENESWSDELRERFMRNEPIMGQYSPAIQPAQERALKVILDCPIDGKLGEMFMEASITQVMLLQLHALFQKKEPKVSNVSSRDLGMARCLKEYLTKTFLEDHSLDTLARHYGTNTNKLMTLFKRVFGSSIFDFLGNLRMEHAHQLLTREHALVADVARVVRYKNPNHFSAAFKRKFGITPSQARA